MKIIIQNLAIEYQDEGAGPVVLMLHGWKDSLKTFDALARELSASHRVVRVDLPGFGGSEIPKETWNISRYVEFVGEFISKLNLQVDTLVGHSFGGRITIRGVGSGALEPKRIILISAAGLANRRTIRNSILSAIGSIGKILTTIPPLSFWRYQLRRALYESIGSDYFAAGALKDTFVQVVEEDLSSYAKKIFIPTLLIWGSRDQSTPLDQGRRANELISSSKLYVIEGGHFIHQDNSPGVSQLIKSFI